MPMRRARYARRRRGYRRSSQYTRRPYKKRRYSQTRNRYPRSKIARRTEKPPRLATKQTGVTWTTGALSSLTASTTAILASVDLTYYSWPMGNMLIQPLPYPDPTAQQDTDLQCRSRNIVNIHGWKIQRKIWFRIPSDSAAVNGVGIQPIEVHYCLLQMKDDRNTEGTNLGTNAIADFFRAYGYADKREENFVPYDATTTAWQQNMNDAPLNPTGFFNIISHKKKTLWNQYGAQNRSWKSYCWSMDYYQRYGKNVQYRTMATTLPDHPIYEVMWYNSKTPDGFPASNPVLTNYIQTMHCNRVYWSEQYC